MQSRLRHNLFFRDSLVCGPRKVRPLQLCQIELPLAGTSQQDSDEARASGAFGGGWTHRTGLGMVLQTSKGKEMVETVLKTMA